VQIAYPDLVEDKHTLKKGMHRHPKAPLKNIFENNNITGSRVWIAFSLRCPPAAELLVM
jgi:hypothetical protein